MKSCDHSQWLSLETQAQAVFFHYTDRIQNLIESLPNPDTRYPGLIVLIGRKTKSLVLRELVSIERKPSLGVRSPHRGVHLHLDASSVFHENPVLYADASLPIALVSGATYQKVRCHESVGRKLCRNSGDTFDLTGIEAADYLYSRLLRPFSDVFCLFIADLGGLEPVTERLVSWLEKAQTPTVPQTAHPILVLVVESEVPGIKTEREAKSKLLSMLEQKTPKSIFDHFFDVTVVSIFPEGKLSLQARHRRVKERLRDALDQGQERRMGIGMLFSATHLAVFFRHACDHFGTTIDDPFNFIQTSRLRNPVSTEIDRHLARFLKHVRTPQELVKFAIPVIGSSFLLNAYPPDMHAFRPSDVFQAWYMDACRQIGRIGMLEGLLPSTFVKLVEHRFSRGFAKLTRGSGVTSASLHLENLQRFRSYWQRIRDNDLCLVCLDQTPEYTLPCSHMMCEACVQRYWSNDEHPWVFRLAECLLCKSSFPQQATVKIRDPSRGLRVLSLDGGGIRGIVHPILLKVLQDRIDLPLPVQENFDVAVGTSCGALVILAMSMAGLSVDDCIQAFEDLARKAFKPHGVSGIPFVSAIEKVIISYFEDSMYPPEGLENALKQVFGDTMTMFNSSYAATIGTKIAVTATTILESSPCLFRNYKKVGKRHKEYGYHIIEPQDGYSDPKVWQVARCASAAPTYFTPLDIPGVGAYQDGGPWKNNPVALVNPEIEAIAPLTEEPLLISVGTGSAEERGVPNTSAPRRGWKDKSPFRHFRAYENSMDGKRLSQDFKNQRRMATEETYFRFDVNFHGRQPGLDAVCEIPWIKATAQEQFSGSEEVGHVASLLRVSHFHFELEAMPKNRGGQYFGAGHILCDLKRSHPAYEALLDRLSSGGARFYVNGELISGKIGDRSFVDTDGNFRKRVEFESINGKLSITLSTSEWRPLNISGSPFLIKKRIEDQKLDAYFGQANHQKRKRFEQGSLPAKRRRRIIK